MATLMFFLMFFFNSKNFLNKPWLLKNGLKKIILWTLKLERQND